MQEGGYIKVYRSIFSCEELDQSSAYTEREAWLYLLMNASYRVESVEHSGGIYHLSVGEQIISNRVLAEQWGWNRMSVQRFRHKLERAKMITIKKHGNTTILSIENFTKYQHNLTAKKDSLVPEKQLAHELAHVPPQNDPQARTETGKTTGTKGGTRAKDCATKNEKPVPPLHYKELNNLKGYCTREGKSSKNGNENTPSEQLPFDPYPSTSESLSADAPLPAPDMTAIRIPESLDSGSCRSAWLDWRRYWRKSKNKPMVDEVAKRQMEFLTSLGHDRALQSIEQSLRNGWENLYAPEDTRQRGKDKVCADNQPKETEAEMKARIARGKAETARIKALPRTPEDEAREMEEIAKAYGIKS